VYRFARRPAWIVSHMLVLVATVVMILLGFWQLDRLDQRQRENDRVVSRSEQPVQAFTELVAGAVVGETDELDWRVAEASGTYVADGQVLVVNRSLDGAAGAWVLTPLRTGDGVNVIVNRGWVPFAVQSSDDRSLIDPPSGEVTVIGLVQSTQPRGRIGAGNPDDPDLLARVDLASYTERLGLEVAPAYLQLEQQSPPAPDLPRPLPRPELGNGPHLSYAGQWFIFASIAAIGYLLVLRKVARSQTRTDADVELR
jgi:cytochrome oxidase assembly protein ShyY1